MKLVFLKQNIVVNVATCPEGELQKYEQLILDKDIADTIIHVEDDCYVGNGFTYDGTRFTSHDDPTQKTLPEEPYTVDASNIDTVTDKLIN